MLIIQAICLAPSRELARQIQEVVDKLGQFTSITTFLAVPGGWTRGVRIEKHILIGTPGTLVDMLSRGKIFDPKQIRVFVLDEADEMVAAQGLGDQTSRIKRCVQSTEILPKANILEGCSHPRSRMFCSQPRSPTKSNNLPKILHPNPTKSFSSPRKSLSTLSNSSIWNVTARSRNTKRYPLCTIACPSGRVSCFVK